MEPPIAARCAPGSRRVVGVVANGLDAPYPRVNAELWESVAREGLLLSEWPPGTEPERFRFPQRNRILAALCELLVVVESRERGGSLTTAREALERSIEVMAVPGSVHNRAAAGTNQLIRDGATPVTDAADVMLALGLDHRRVGHGYDPRPAPAWRGGQGAGALPRRSVHARRRRRRPRSADHRGGDDACPPRALGLGARGGRMVRGGGSVSRRSAEESSSSRESSACPPAVGPHRIPSIRWPLPSPNPPTSRRRGDSSRSRSR